MVTETPVQEKAQETLQSIPLKDRPRIKLNNPFEVEGKYNGEMRRGVINSYRPGIDSEGLMNARTVGAYVVSHGIGTKGIVEETQPEVYMKNGRYSSNKDSAWLEGREVKPKEEIKLDYDIVQTADGRELELFEEEPYKTPEPKKSVSLAFNFDELDVAVELIREKEMQEKQEKIDALYRIGSFEGKYEGAFRNRLNEKLASGEVEVLESGKIVPKTPQVPRFEDSDLPEYQVTLPTAPNAEWEEFFKEYSRDSSLVARNFSDRYEALDQVSPESAQKLLDMLDRHFLEEMKYMPSNMKRLTLDQAYQSADRIYSLIYGDELPEVKPEEPKSKDKRITIFRRDFSLRWPWSRSRRS